MRGGPTTKWWWLGLAGLIGAALVALVFWPRRGMNLRESQTRTASNHVSRVVGQPLERPQPVANNPIQVALADLKLIADGDAAVYPLSRLRETLQKLSPAQASALIRTFLDSKDDAATRRQFRLGPDGSLTDAPTLRTFLLDYLTQADRPAAAAYAQKILQTKDSPDEWAVSLRAYALEYPTTEGKSFLEQKLRELLQHEPWRNQPSVGFLEAFDVIVYAGSASLTPTLAELVREKENRAVAHAAFLTLDRLTLQNPKVVLSELLRQPDLMAGREQTRANFFARGNVADSEQRQLLENYLLNPRLSEEELQTFAGLFPNANYMISHNLLTQTVTPTGEALARQDRKALEVVNGWLADPRFESRKPQLIRIRDRLATFVEQRSGGPRP